MSINALGRQIRAMKTPTGQSMLKKISEVDPTIPYMLAGAAGHHILPQGIRAALEGVIGTAGVGSILLHPSTWPAAVTAGVSGALATSPSVASHLNALYGVPTAASRSPLAKAAYYAGRANETTPTSPQQPPQNLFQNASLPRNARNNNFGNIKDGQFAKSQPGYAGTDGTFARFDTPEHGAEATKALVRYYLGSGRDTPEKFTADWLKGSENTDEDRAMYGSRIADALNLNSGSKINPTDENVEKIFHAVARGEGSDYPEKITRTERASGGRTTIDHAAEADKLIRKAEQTKKSLGKATQALLGLSDDHIAKALAVANESV